MKTRQAFVANSSSSSFIIGVKAIPTSVEEAGEILFGDKKQYFAPIIIEGLYNGLKPFPLNFDRLLELAKTIKQINNPAIQFHNDDYDVIDNEAWLLNQLANQFTWGDEYGDLYFGSSQDSNFDIYLKEVMAKKFPDAKSKHDIKFQERLKIENKYYRLKEVKERWIKEVESCILDLKGWGEVKNENFLIGEFGDDFGELGSRLEHGDHWDQFEVVKFSHH